MIFPNEFLGCPLVFFRQGICSFLLACSDVYQFTIHHDKVENTFITSMYHVNMNRLMLVRVEIKYETEVFKYLRHIYYTIVVSRRQRYKKIRYSQKNIRKMFCINAILPSVESADMGGDYWWRVFAVKKRSALRK